MKLLIALLVALPLKADPPKKDYQKDGLTVYQKNVICCTACIERAGMDFGFMVDENTCKCWKKVVEPPKEVKEL